MKGIVPPPSQVLKSEGPGCTLTLEFDIVIETGATCRIYLYGHDSEG